MNWDVVISNPPYISPRDFDTTTTRSVRNHEPKIALVPPRSSLNNRSSMVSDTEHGDAFYPYILRLANFIRAKIIVVEVAGMEQASRVAGMILRDAEWESCQIWRDSLGQNKRTRESECATINGRPIVVKGEGNGRAVFAWKGTKPWPVENALQ